MYLLPEADDAHPKEGQQHRERCTNQPLCFAPLLNTSQRLQFVLHLNLFVEPLL